MAIVSLSGNADRNAQTTASAENNSRKIDGSHKKIKACYTITILFFHLALNLIF